MKTLAAIVIATTVVTTTVLTAVVEEGCTPAQKAEFSQIENVVLADIEADKSQEQIEADAAKIVVGDGGLTLIDTIISDAIQTLIDLKKISAGKLPTATAMQAKLGAHHQ